MAESDASTGQVVRGEFNHDTVTRKYSNVVLAHAATQVAKNLVTVLQLHLELRVWQGLKNRPFDGDRIRVLPSWSRLRGCGRRYATTSTLLLLLCLCFLNQIQYLISYTH